MNKLLRGLLLTIGIPVLYGLLLRLIFDMDVLKRWGSVMSISFLLLVPYVIGILTIAFASDENIQSFRYRTMMPWVSSLCLLAVTFLLKIEGMACWIMLLPLFLVLASLGGLTAGYFRLKQRRRHDRLNISIAVLLPFLASPIEHAFPIPSTTFKAYTYIDIAAPDSVIWQHVVRVKEISATEDRGHLTNYLGFPRPIKAELDTLAVGGTRKAVFSKGLVFTEVVTNYEAQKFMRFTIKANPYEIPSIAMDEHVVIGGDYFDVLDGTYEMERLSNNLYRLHLYSHFELSTTFNWYAGWWAKWIMKDIQRNILRVVKTRCEIKR